MSKPIKNPPEGLRLMPVIDHVLYAGCYLPARSTFIDCPCSLDPGPYGTVVRCRSLAAPGGGGPVGRAVLSVLEVVEVALPPRWRVP